jgi:hypothetical protein
MVDSQGKTSGQQGAQQDDIPPPTMVDRIEAAHWAGVAAHYLLSYRASIASRHLSPTYAQAIEDLDVLIGKIELAKKALRGQHTRDATSILQDLQETELRDQDTRPNVRRRRERSA